MSSFELQLASNLEATGTKWEPVRFPMGTLGHLGLHAAPLAEGLKSHHSRSGRAAAAQCSLRGPAGAAVSAFQFCRVVADFIKPRARMCRSQKVTGIILNWSLTKMDSFNPMPKAPRSPTLVDKADKRSCCCRDLLSM